ncbi:transmembrane 4 L6 family member 20 [Pseudophryne corroboree]|uniref:transmembrane 4 L6 family member 20 n=1 Tax=Pseudophryne corroboree TaxID=495146 RepID=UPI0030817919
MTCTENWTSCNGFSLLLLALLAIAFNLTPLVADYVEDGRLFHSPISCYEWWLPGVVGGGLLVLPAVSMSLAARKKGSCNSRAGMLSSALLSVVAIIGGAYCTVIAIFAISKGPLICEKGSKSLDQCDYTLGNLSNFQSLKFDLLWFLNDTCIPTSNNVNMTGLGIIQERLPDFELDLEINEDTQKIIHITVFVALSIIGLLQAIAAVSQIVAGLFGFLCGTSTKHEDYD